MQYAEIVAERQQRWHMTADRLAPMGQHLASGLLQFVREAGLVLDSPSNVMLVPSLWDAIDRTDYDPYTNQIDLYSSRRSWLEQRLVWSGYFIRHAISYISLDLFPAYYALSRNFDETDDYLSEYRDGFMTQEAKQLYTHFVEHGPISIEQLKQKLRIKPGKLNMKFNQTLQRLTADFKVMMVGEGDVYEVVVRQLPEQVAAAGRLKQEQAMRQVVGSLLTTNYAMPRSYFNRLFGWGGREWNDTLCQSVLDRLIAVGQASEVDVEGSNEQVKGKPDRWVVWNGAFECQHKWLRDSEERGFVA